MGADPTRAGSAEVVLNGHRPLRLPRRAVKFDPGHVEVTLRAVLRRRGEDVAQKRCARRILDG